MKCDHRHLSKVKNCHTFIAVLTVILYWHWKHNESEIVKQSQLNSSKMGHEIFFLVIYLLRPFDISVGIILMECSLTATIVCETGNYFKCGACCCALCIQSHVWTVRHSYLLKNSFCYHKCGICNDKVIFSIISCVWHFLPLHWKPWIPVKPFRSFVVYH